MTRPRPSAVVPRAYAAEYQRATGQPVQVIARDVCRGWIASPYVEWLEMELKRARARISADAEVYSEMSAAARESVRRLRETEPRTEKETP